MIDDLRRLDDYVFYPDGGGEAFSIGIIVCFFFYDGRTSQKMAARLPFFRSFAQFAEDKLDLYLPPDTETPVRNATCTEVLKYIEDQVAKPATAQANIVSGFSGPDRGIGDPQCFYIEICPGNKDLGHILAYLPAGWVEHVGSARFVDQMREWAGLLGTAHGTVGLGCQFSFAFSYGGYNFFPYLKRFVGLDMGDVNMWSFEIGQTSERLIRTTNWLTYIDNAFVDRLGGRRELAGKLDGSCDLADYNGGLFMQAGSVPAVGDVNNDDIPGGYRAVARALAPIRFEAFRHKNAGMFSTPASFNNLKESKAWVRRFD